tara:strand:+ start:54 stop:428 length:375 start_codon:yes stop_codon:yes gene_type:complete
MANYLKATDFAAKDALLSGDPNKIVKGTEINDEFDSLQTAVNSKANSSSPTFTGTPIAPTAALDTNTTQIATTAFITRLINWSDFTIVESGTDLLVKYNGVSIAKITAAGALIIKSDITTFGTL